MWENDIGRLRCAARECLVTSLQCSRFAGRYTASNYGILKTVFEVNLQVFQSDSYAAQLQPNRPHHVSYRACSKSQLLFVIRDHNEEETPLEALKVTLWLHRCACFLSDACSVCADQAD